MGKWSDKLIELSKEYLEYDGTHCKHQKGIFGILSIDRENKTYTISLKPELTEKLVFNSVSEMINSGWVVD